MFKQVEFSFDNTIATPSGSNWNPVNVTGYDTIVVQVIAPTGWTGTISFWGGTGTTPTAAGALWALNDAENASSTAVVSSVVGATPSYYAKNFRGSIAGLSVFGVYFANPTTYTDAIGNFTVKIGLYAAAK